MLSLAVASLEGLSQGRVTCLTVICSAMCMVRAGVGYLTGVFFLAHHSHQI